jgi:hypothetical protein
MVSFLHHFFLPMLEELSNSLESQKHHPYKMKTCELLKPSPCSAVPSLKQMSPMNNPCPTHPQRRKGCRFANSLLFCVSTCVLVSATGHGHVAQRHIVIIRKMLHLSQSLCLLQQVLRNGAGASVSQAKRNSRLFSSSP